MKVKVNVNSTDSEVEVEEEAVLEEAVPVEVTTEKGDEL